MRSIRRGFTLVELLVVIGIIALLIAILLPTLSSARRAAQRTACAARLNQIVLAAQLHRSDHRGYYPLVGVVPGITPDELDDPDAAKYDYTSLRSTGINSTFYPRRLAGVTDSLGLEMSYKQQMGGSNTQAVALMYDQSSYLKNFLCPSQASNFGELAAHTPAQYSLLFFTFADGTTYFSEPQSYIYNEFVMGWDNSNFRLKGRADAVRQPASTMFAADGVHGTTGLEVYGDWATYTLFNWVNKKPITLADILSAKIPAGSRTPLASDPACFDKPRHQGKINIAYCDGHVESRAISTGDLNNVFLAAP